MDLKAAIAALVSAAPPDATVPVRWLGELLASDTDAVPLQPSAGESLSIDFTVAQVASRFGKGESTVRTWLARGELPGSYRLHGHEWRIPAAAVGALQASQARKHTRGPAAPRKSRHAPDLGEWRKHVRAVPAPAVQQ